MPSWMAYPVVSLVAWADRLKPAPARPAAYFRLGLVCQLRPRSREMYTSIRPPDNKIVPPAVIDALPRYPPAGGLAARGQVGPWSPGAKAVLNCWPPPGPRPQPRNRPPPCAAVTGLPKPGSPGPAVA